MATNEISLQNLKEIELETIQEALVPEELYEKVFQRDAGLCQRPECRAGGTQTHHIVFRSQGGPDIPGNLVLLCQDHHSEAHENQIWRHYWEKWKPKKYVDYIIHEY